MEDLHSFNRLSINVIYQNQILTDTSTSIRDMVRIIYLCTTLFKRYGKGVLNDHMSTTFTRSKKKTPR